MELRKSKRVKRLTMKRRREIISAREQILRLMKDYKEKTGNMNFTMKDQYIAVQRLKAERNGLLKVQLLQFLDKKQLFDKEKEKEK